MPARGVRQTVPGCSLTHYMCPRLRLCSWWADQFCAGNTSDAVNVVTTELLPVLDL